VSTATAIVEGGEITLYANGFNTTPKTTLGGLLSITVGGAVSGDATFDKPIQGAPKGAYYATGFRGAYDVTGGLYTKPPVGTRILATNATGQVTATFSGAGYPTPFDRTFTLTTANLFSPAANPPVTQFKLNAAGQLTGTIKSPTNTNLAITGLAFPNGASMEAIGCFLYPTGAYEGGGVKVIAAP
jgi:hypothetical protein